MTPPAVLMEALLLLGVRPEEILSNSEISPTQIANYISGDKECLKLHHLEMITCKLEDQGIFFQFKDGEAQSAALRATNPGYSKPTTVHEQAECFGSDAHLFFHSADRLEDNFGTLQRQGFLSLPVLFLLCQSMELSLKSFILAATDETGQLLVEKGKSNLRTHNLYILLEKARRKGIDKVHPINDLHKSLTYDLGACHVKGYNKYREMTREHSPIFFESTFELGRILLRASRPKLRSPDGPYISDQVFRVAVKAGSQRST